jgi:hypothetical protein
MQYYQIEDDLSKPEANWMTWTIFKPPILGLERLGPEQIIGEEQRRWWKRHCRSNESPVRIMGINSMDEDDTTTRRIEVDCDLLSLPVGVENTRNQTFLRHSERTVEVTDFPTSRRLLEVDEGRGRCTEVFWTYFVRSPGTAEQPTTMSDK